ncbi:hypothetical protein, partial [Sandarakinorhabdus rubra]|uniref:hypothetical protein n=1 Tax=Sandarakinorhabdus rubra TaxID=2672568 RepID=UPI0013DC3512
QGARGGCITVGQRHARPELPCRRSCCRHFIQLGKGAAGGVAVRPALDPGHAEQYGGAICSGGPVSQGGAIMVERQARQEALLGYIAEQPVQPNPVCRAGKALDRRQGSGNTPHIGWPSDETRLGFRRHTGQLVCNNRSRIGRHGRAGRHNNCKTGRQQNRKQRAHGTRNADRPMKSRAGGHGHFMQIVAVLCQASP